MSEDIICRYCGVIHQGICPLIRAMDFYKNGALKRVEFNDPPGACQHRNKLDLSTSGWERWLCKDCGHQHEKPLN